MEGRNEFVETVVMERKNYDKLRSQLSVYRDMICSIEKLIWDEIEKELDYQKNNSKLNCVETALLRVSKISEIIGFEDEFETEVERAEQIMKENKEKEAEGNQE